MACLCVPGTPRVILTFRDGTVGMYDVKKRRLEWHTEGGHTETIFDCAFSTTDPDLLATSSYDSSVRVWDVTTAKCKYVVTASGAAASGVAASRVA